MDVIIAAKVAPRSSRQSLTLSHEENMALSSNDHFLFPLLQDITVNGKINPQIYNAQYVLFILQTIIGSFFLTSKHIWPKMTPVVDIFSVFIDLRIHHYNNALIYYICGIIFSAILLLWGAFLSFKYFKTRSFQKSHVKITRFLYIIVIPAVLPISSSFLERSFLDVLDYGTPANYIFFIIYIIIFISLYYMTLVGIQFKVYSTVIVPCYLIEWTPTIHTIFVTIGSLTPLGPIFSRLPQWCQFVFTFIICMIDLMTFLIMQMYPFFHTSINFSISCVLFYLTFMSLFFSFKVILLDAFPMSIVCILPLVLLIVFIPIYGFFIKKRNAKIIDFLSVHDVLFTEEELQAHFASARFENIYQIFPYLQLGVEHNCDYIIDLSFLHFLAVNFRDKNILLKIAHVVCFIPAESEFLNALVETIDQFEDLHYFQKYFLFQMKKLLVVRQSTSSDEVNDHIYRLRKLSKNAIESIRGLWLEIIHSKGLLSYSVFKSIYDTSNHVKMQFLDILSKYSNNYEICDEYSKFLIEGMSDFSSAITWERKKLLIEEGRKLDNDYSFRSFVNTFPHYLTKRIMDMKGHFIMNGDPTHYEVTAAPLLVKEESTLMDGEYIDENAELMDETISFGRIRISIQSAFSKATFKKLKSVEYLLYAQTLFVILLFIINMLFLPSTNDDSVFLLETVQYLSETTINFLLGAYYHSIQICVDEFQYSVYYLKDSIPISDTDVKKIHSLMNNSLVTIEAVENGRNYFDLFLEKLSQSSKFVHLRSFFNEQRLSMPFYEFYLVNNIIENMSIKQIVAYIFSESQRVAAHQYNDPMAWQTDDRSTIVFNSLLVSRELEDIRMKLIKLWDDIGNSQKTANLAIGILMSLAVFIIFIPFQIMSIYRLYKEVYEIVGMLQKMKPEIINTSLLPIQLHQMPQPLAKGSYLSVVQNSYIFIVLFILGIFSAILPAILLFFTPYINYLYMNDVKDYLFWHLLSSSRLISAIMSVSSLFLNLVVTPDENQTLYMLFNESIKIHLETHMRLLYGDETSGTIIGAEKGLNEFHFLDTCNQTVHNTSAFIDYVKCVSIDRAISYMQYLFMKMINKISPPADALNEATYSDFVVLLELRIIQAVRAYQVLIVDYVNDNVEFVDTTILAISIIGIIVTLIFLILLFFSLRYLHLTFEGIKQMIRFLPPEEIINSPQLMSLILDETMTNTETMTKSQAILASTRNGVCSVSSVGIIETVNTSFVKITGYPQEQALGQPFTSLFSHTPSPEYQTDHVAGLQQLNHALELMRNGNGKVAESFFMHCQLESGKVITVQLYVIACEDTENRRKNGAFLIMMRDLSEDDKQKRQAHDVKKKSEILIRQIVPPEVYRVIRMATGSTLFSSKKATIIIIQISGFLEMVNSRLPQAVVGIMGTFFDRFAEIATQYPAVHEILTMENNFIACCGLFDFQEQPNDQATQAVLFALDILDSLPALNKDCDSSLNLKFALNHGGPLFGSVLDSSAPQFCVYGKPYEYSLLSIMEAKENVVEVSQSVRDLIFTDTDKFSIKQSFYPNKITQIYELYDVTRPNA